MRGGALAADKVGLMDPQGFVRGNHNLYEPLRFIDIHTSWNAATNKYGHSEVAQEILEIADAWGQS